MRLCSQKFSTPLPSTGEVTLASRDGRSHLSTEQEPGRTLPSFMQVLFFMV